MQISLRWPFLRFEEIFMSREQQQRILRMPETKARTGVPRSSIYRLLAMGEFPRPIKLGARSIGFVESEVDAWIADRIAASRTTRKERLRGRRSA